MRALLLTLSLAMAGCSTLTDRVSQRFTPAEPPRRVFDHPEEAVFAAAQSVLDQQGYRITRAAAAQGIIEAESRRLPTERFGASQQYAIAVRLRSPDPGVTSVTVQVHQQTEGDFAAGPSSTPLRESGRYDTFFDGLQLALSRDQGE